MDMTNPHAAGVSLARCLAALYIYIKERDCPFYCCRLLCADDGKPGCGVLRHLTAEVIV